MTADNIQDAIEAIRSGEFVLVTDDEDRENEGDLFLAAELATAKKIGFMVRHTSGVLTVPMAGELLDHLELEQMVARNTEAHCTAFTVSVDHAESSTGISAEDRTKTITALADPASKKTDFSRPGHVFPLRAKPGGVLKRAGHTEASVDLCLLAGLRPAAVICELVDDEGRMLRGEALRLFAKKYSIPTMSIAELIIYRRKKETLVEQVSSTTIPTAQGEFHCYAYRSILDGTEHLALVKGDIANQSNVLVRVHSECLTGDVFGSLRCDCGKQLDWCLGQIAKAGVGAVVYLRGHEGRGIGLAHKIAAYNLQDLGRDTVEANVELGLPVDRREYGLGAQILSNLGVTTMRVMTNNPTKYGGLEGYGLKIVERIAIPMQANTHNSHYLKTKQEKMGHLIT